MNKKIVFVTILMLGTVVSSIAQERVVSFSYGDMDRWVTRKIHESGIIGGDTKLLYEVGPTQVIEKNEAYKNTGGSPWANSNVMAKVAGITKTNTSVFPEKRGNGYCARLDTRMESVKVFGIVDITVLAAGSMFLGTVHEPITGTKNPMKWLGFGVPFKDKPDALRFDYKIKMSGATHRIKSTGFSRQSEVKGKDYPCVVLLLQKRWEDSKGNIFAKRIGTMIVRYDKNTDWVNNATYPIMYGDITNNPAYKAEYMGLASTNHFSQNSKGKSVQIQEVGWGTEDDVPTHLILQFSASHGGAYIGSPGNSMWVDNVKLVYNK